MNTRIDTFHLGRWGEMKFKQWLFSENVLGFNEHTVDYYASLIPPGSFAIDIGAYTGDDTIPMALAAGKDGGVLAFEPNPVTFKLLEENVALNNLDTVGYFNAAVMGHPGLFRFHYESELCINGGFSEALDVGAKGCGNTHALTVPGVSLSRLLDEHYPAGRDSLSFIKIDAEGYDKEIVRANSGLLRKYRPTLQVEVYPYLTLRERAEFRQLLDDLDYSYDHSEASWSSTTLVHNIICRPK